MPELTGTGGQHVLDGPSPPCSASASAMARLSRSWRLISAKFSGSTASAAPAPRPHRAAVAAPWRGCVPRRVPVVICTAATFMPAPRRTGRCRTAVSACRRIGRPSCVSSSASTDGFLLQQPAHHVLVRQHHQLLALELPALPHQLAIDLVAHRFRRAHEAAPLALRTRRAQQVLQALARALARHLHQAQRRDVGDMCLRPVRGQRRLQCRQQRLAMILVLHVDEVDDDDAAEVAHPQLPRNGDRRLEIGAEDGFLQVAMTDIAAGVHVHRGHGLGLLDHDVATGLQRHALHPARD